MRCAILGVDEGTGVKGSPRGVFEWRGFGSSFEASAALYDPKTH